MMETDSTAMDLSEHTYESLDELSIAELKRMCEKANLKTARSSKDVLIRRLLDPVTNNKDNLPNSSVLHSSRFTVDYLRHMCEVRNLPKDGSKAKLIARLIDPAAHQKWGRIPAGRGGRGSRGGTRGGRGGARGGGRGGRGRGGRAS